MRAFLLLSVFVAALSFDVSLLKLELAGETISRAFELQSFLNFDPEHHATQHYELQAFDAQMCVGAWGAIAQQLNNQTDPCNGVQLLFPNLRNWTGGQIAFYVNSFCFAQGGACRMKYQQLYDNMLNVCGGFNPRPAVVALQNSTDQVARMIRTLIDVPCLRDDATAYTANNFTDPMLDSPMFPGGVVPSIPYTWTPCWVHFAALANTNIDIVSSADLTATCTPCSRNIAKYLTTNAVPQLAVAARQALSFCDQKKNAAGAPEFCALKIQQFRRASANPDFQAQIKSANVTAIGQLCDRCNFWGLELTLSLLKALRQWDPKQVSDVTVAQVQQGSNALSFSCDKDGETWCLSRAAKYDQSFLIKEFGPCILKCSFKTNPDPCWLVLRRIYNDTRCCIRSFLLGLELNPPAGIPPNLIPDILTSCGFTADKLPKTCSRKKIVAHLPLRNVLYTYVQSQPKDRLINWFAASLGIDYRSVADVNCWQTVGWNTTTCNVTYYPPSTADAQLLVNDFTDNIAAGTQGVWNLDVVDFGAANSARENDTADAYVATDFSAATETACIQAQSPLMETTDSQGNCVSNCENGVKDADETDVDCGGFCKGCPVDKACMSISDCDNTTYTASKHTDCQNKKCVWVGSGASTLHISPVILALFALLGFFLM